MGKDDLVARMAVGGDQPRPRDVTPDGVVDVPAVVPVGSKIDDGHSAESAAPAVHPAGPIGDPERLPISDRAGRDDITIDIVAADALIELQELLGADLTGVEGGHAVLDADVVEGPAREAGLGVPAKDVDHVVVPGAAGPAAVRDRVIDERQGEGQIAARGFGGGRIGFVRAVPRAI